MHFEFANSKEDKDAAPTSKIMLGLLRSEWVVMTNFLVKNTTITGADWESKNKL